MPSSRRAASSTSATAGLLAGLREPRSILMAFSSEMFNTFGTSFVSRSTSAKLISSTAHVLNRRPRPSVPMVTICATCSRPYFSVT